MNIRLPSGMVIVQNGITPRCARHNRTLSKLFKVKDGTGWGFLCPNCESDGLAPKIISLEKDEAGN